MDRIVAHQKIKVRKPILMPLHLDSNSSVHEYNLYNRRVDKSCSRNIDSYSLPKQWGLGIADALGYDGDKKAKDRLNSPDRAI